MTQKSLQVLFIFILTATLSYRAQSQNIFVKVTDEFGAVLTGTSTAVGFVNQTQIESYGQESSACEGSVNSCFPVTGNFVYNFLMDQTITDYRRALYLRRVWRKVEITFTRLASGGGSLVAYYKVTLEDVNVVGLTEANEPGTSAIRVQVKLDPVKITWTFTPTLSNGAQGTPRSFGYNRSTNTAF